MPGWICSIILLAILSPFFLFLFFYASVRCFQFIYRQNSGGAGRQDVRSPVLGNRPSLTDREKALEAARAVGQPQQPKVSSLHKYRSLNHASAYSPPFFSLFSLFFFHWQLPAPTPEAAPSATEISEEDMKRKVIAIINEYLGILDIKVRL